LIIHPVWHKNRLCKTNTALNCFSAAQNFVTASALALTGLKAWVCLVDNVDAAFATDQFIVAMTLHQTLEGIADFHAHTYMMALSHRNEIVRCP
jgi:hypothetical protein